MQVAERCHRVALLTAAACVAAGHADSQGVEAVAVLAGAANESLGVAGGAEGAARLALRRSPGGERVLAGLAERQCGGQAGRGLLAGCAAESTQFWL